MNWSNEEEFSDLLEYCNKLVHVETKDCLVEGILRLCDTVHNQLVIERQYRSYAQKDGYWETYPGNQMDRIVLQIPLIPGPTVTYVVLSDPLKVMYLVNGEIVAETALDEEYNVPPPPEQKVPSYCIFNEHTEAAMAAALHANHGCVVHLSYETQKDSSEYVNMQASTGLEGRILNTVAIQSTTGVRLVVSFEVWDRVEWGLIYVRRPDSPKIYDILYPYGCRALQPINGAKDVYYLN